jgi:integrase
MKVTIENLKGRLRLRWTCPETGKPKNLALGVEDSTTSRSIASGTKEQIENDAKYGYYDSSLLKYRPLTICKNASEITTVELFDRFTQYQFKSEGWLSQLEGKKCSDSYIFYLYSTSNLT